MHWRVTKCLQERELNNSRQFVSSSFTPLLYHLLLQAPKVPAGRGCREGTRALWNPHIPPEGQHLPQEQQLCWAGCPGRQHWDKGIQGLGGKCAQGPFVFTLLHRAAEAPALL